jgi:type VI protein secretion system component VasK
VLRVLLAPRWLVRHVLLAVALVVCWLFGRWQYGRAITRHSVLNWSYTVEWTLFGAFAVLCWGWFLRDELRGEEPVEDEPVAPPQQRVALPVTDEEDPELAAYNRMLARLHQKDTP